jgi:hypothetical protein
MTGPKTKTEIVLNAAREEHARGVTDDKAGAPRIDDYIKQGLGWKGWLWRGLPQRRYRPQRFEWCGAFVAWCFSLVGLLPSVRRKHMASCYRLWRWSGKGKPNERRIAPGDLHPGDIAVVGPEPAPRDAPRSERKARPRWGRHIVLVVKVTSEFLHTIEGNARGQIKGGVIEGVIRGTRPLHAVDPGTFRILYGVRPVEADYDD